LSINSIAIRKENIDNTEKRSPLSPQHVHKLIHVHSTNVIVEPWSNRHFHDEQFIQSGALLSADLEKANIIFGVKEIPVDDLLPNKACAFFSHTIKGQSYNMPLLQAILDKKVTLMDYERVLDDSGRRLIFFGPYAGLAGAVNAIWLLGKRLKMEGIDNPFSIVNQAKTYNTLADAKNDLQKVRKAIEKNGLPRTGKPWVIVITGNGTVSKGAQEIIDILPVHEITPEYFLELRHFQNFDLNILYKVVIDCDNFVKPVDPKNHFDWQDYFNHPEKYQGDFNKYLPEITVLINGIYWNTMFPKLVTKADLRSLFTKDKNPNLKIIADITCDIEGSIECNLKTTTSDAPTYVYNPFDGTIKDGIEGTGPVIMAVDKLPSELPGEATTFFGASLIPFVPALAKVDFSKDFDNLAIPKEFKRAVIAHQGKLTKDYQYLKKFL
jgi:alanine dehydrogenase